MRANSLADAYRARWAGGTQASREGAEWDVVKAATVFVFAPVMVMFLSGGHRFMHGTL
ncbi:MAG: hypothetical protein M1136_12695 [Chloroflexi bacterium]|nr:hypothetical protein [Chloroflexota bacterium]MCL5076482.1 hypothetical protein [Chloroflexota bacterium]